jgi:pimeloyl-ACP methyl ester carboxylesterase
MSLNDWRATLQAEVVAAIDVAADLERVTCPVLLVSGDLDVPSPPAPNVANAGKVRVGRCVLIADCGHIVPLEKPQALLGAMQPLL